jgi:hypothetical protein
MFGDFGVCFQGEETQYKRIEGCPHGGKCELKPCKNFEVCKNKEPHDWIDDWDGLCHDCFDAKVVEPKTTIEVQRQIMEKHITNQVASFDRNQRAASRQTITSLLAAEIAKIDDLIKKDAEGEDFNVLLKQMQP